MVKVQGEKLQLQDKEVTELEKKVLKLEQELDDVKKVNKKFEEKEIKEKLIFNHEKIINDPIYGGIPVNKIELELIDTDIFQRLRDIKQLGGVNKVFPSADHSRFAHSLGVLFIMQKMTKHLYDIGGLDLEEVKTMRVAALLHDIGHYPLSHLGETVYNYHHHKNNNILIGSSKIPVVDNLDKDKISIYELSSAYRKDDKCHHEILGAEIIKKHKEISKILEKYGLDPEEIGGIITGNYGQKYIYTQLLHSSLDADRLDYLMRDSYYTGVNYGLVDIDYIVNLIRVHEQEVDQQKQKIICFDIKGQHVIEHFLMARYFHYSQIIFHKTNASFEGLIKVLYLKLLDEKGFIFNNYEDIINHINDDKILQFNDSTLYSKLDEHFYKTNDEDYKILYKNLKSRKRPKIVYEMKDLHNGRLSKEMFKIKYILDKCPEKIEEIIGNDLWGYQSSPIKISAIKSKYNTNDMIENADNHKEELRDAIKIIDKDKKIKYLAQDDLSIINKVANYTGEFIRIFEFNYDDKSDKHIEIHKSIMSI